MVEKLESSPGSIALSENSHEVHNEIQVNSVSEIVGDFGRWQAVLFIFFFIGAAFSAYHSLGLTFYAPNIVYWCARPTNYQNTSTEEWAKLAKNNETLQCYEVNTPKFDLTCDRAWLASLTQSSYMAGSMLAVIGLGQASDRWGRLPIIWLGFLIEILAAASCTFSFNIYQYLISRFLLAFGASGRWASGFVLILETSGIQYRSFLGIGMQFGWAFGYITLPLIAFMFRDYRLIQFVCFAPEILLIFCWSCVPESPRWLLSNKKLKRANKTIRKAIAMNKRSESSIEQKIAALMSKCKSENEEKSKQRKANLIDLWINPNIRSKTLILYFTW
ncbi:organic cation transporter protein-like isoform X1 [Dinothrombium tinctorium]|uniref:Organic cation transporter protein-like isoform X1 n=1 Tax=Dinothrombium tinctorium TaxID=1965070 RepID=A0A443RHQ9_9ACAR|nr:organic cation transporter protein-like isoform X1 [Dinothrombium tinctorium]